MLKIIIFLALIIIGIIEAYFVNGGWAQNLGELCKNYKDSGLSFGDFIKSIIKNDIR